MSKPTKKAIEKAAVLARAVGFAARSQAWSQEVHRVAQENETTVDIVIQQGLAPSHLAFNDAARQIQEQSGVDRALKAHRSPTVRAGVNKYLHLALIGALSARVRQIQDQEEDLQNLERDIEELFLVETENAGAFS